MSAIATSVLVIVSAVIGFLLLWPLGAVFAKLGWPLFHPWGLAHGSFLMAWPLLGWLVYQITAVGFRRSRERDHNHKTYQAMQLTASNPAVYAWSVCRRTRMLRGMYRGLAAADLVSR